MKTEFNRLQTDFVWSLITPQTCPNLIVNVIGDINKHLYCWKYTLKWLKTTLFTPNVQFWSFIENATSGGTKCLKTQPIFIVLAFLFTASITIPGLQNLACLARLYSGQWTKAETTVVRSLLIGVNELFRFPLYYFLKLNTTHNKGRADNNLLHTLQVLRTMWADSFWCCTLLCHYHMYTFHSHPWLSKHRE